MTPERVAICGPSHVPGVEMSGGECKRLRDSRHMLGAYRDIFCAALFRANLILPQPSEPIQVFKSNDLGRCDFRKIAIAGTTIFESWKLAKESQLSDAH